MKRGKEAPASQGRVPLEQSERLWREQLTQLVDPEELRSYGEQSLPDTFASIGALWLEVIALLAVANILPRLPLAWAIPLGVFVVLMMGLRMNAFGVILHEGSHGSLATSRALNDRICNWGVAFWTVNSVEEYRPTHRLHHRYLGGLSISQPAHRFVHSGSDGVRFQSVSPVRYHSRSCPQRRAKRRPAGRRHYRHGGSHCQRGYGGDER